MVNFNGSKSWKATRDTIATILDDFSLPMVAFEIIKDRINLLYGEKGFEKINS